MIPAFDYMYTVLWLGFFETVIGHLAWPLVVLVIAFLFKKQIVFLAKNLKKFSIAGSEFDFSQEFDEFVDEVRDTGINISVNDIRELKPEDAQLAVLKSYAEIEEIIGDWFERNQIDQTIRSKSGKNVRPISLRSRLIALSKQQIIDDEIVYLVDRLREIRNIAAHTSDFRIHAGEAFDLIAATDGLKERIREALNAHEG